MDLNELAKQPEAVLALMDGEMLFQFEEDKVVVDSSSLNEELKLTEGNEQQSEPLEKPNLVEELEVLVEPTPVQLLLLVYLKDGGTVPEEQRVFLRKMIKATEIPGSHMKYIEIHKPESAVPLRKEWKPQRWVSFGMESTSNSTITNDETWGSGIACPPMEQVWDDIPQKQVLWKLMQTYFNLKKA